MGMGIGSAAFPGPTERRHEGAGASARCIEWRCDLAPASRWQWGYGYSNVPCGLWRRRMRLSHNRPSGTEWRRRSRASLRPIVRAAVPGWRWPSDRGSGWSRGRTQAVYGRAPGVPLQFAGLPGPHATAPATAKAPEILGGDAAREPQNPSGWTVGVGARRSSAERTVEL